MSGIEGRWEGAEQLRLDAGEGEPAEQLGPAIFGDRDASSGGTAAQARPAVSPSGRFVAVLQGAAPRSAQRSAAAHGEYVHSLPAAESFLADVDRSGVECAVRHLDGVFAIAIWDRARAELWLGRDRLGIEPLYYGFTSAGLVFGSDLKVLRSHPEFRSEIYRDALHLYLRYNNVPAPYTIYRDAYKLRPGMLLRFRAPRRDAMEEVVYWSVAEAALSGQRNPFAGTVTDAVEQLDALLRDAITARIPADGAVGAFLSGGVDSSTVVALLQAQSGRRVRTFAIGSPDAEFDEAAHARRIARHLGTDHTELNVTPAEALAVVPRLATIYDEPFADYSQIPTLLVCELARRSVPVALAGDGGDEVFAGYNRHVWGRRVWKAIRVMPTPARVALARGLASVAPEAWDREFERFGPVLPEWLRHRMPGYKIHKLAGSLRARSPIDLYRHLTSSWADPGQVLIGGQAPDDGGPMLPQLADFTSQMVLMDQLGYLPDDGLVKVERASRAVGLDVYAPLLDHRVVEFAWRLPLDSKLREGKTKWVLRQVLYRYVPRALIERPKTGFGVPLGAWLRDPLRGWAEMLLDERRLREDGYFDPAPIRTLWAQHLAGTHRWESQLWSVLMFQAWLDEYSTVPTVGQ